MKTMMPHNLIMPFFAVALATGFLYAALPETGAFPPRAARDMGGIMPSSGGAGIAAHKALYALEMVSATSGAGVVGIRGTMYFEQDDACDAWTTDQRFTMEYQYPERRPVHSTSHYVAWEAKDGSRFEFNSERQENGEVAEHLRGGALRAQDGRGRADYARPGDVSFTLPPGYLLPTAHSQELIRRARAGDTFFNAVLFDGTDADGPVEMNAVIGPKAAQEEINAYAQAAGAQVDPALLTPDAWHVRLAVFPLRDSSAITPAYEMEMVMHDNGVVSHAVVDYGSFRVEQRLETAQRLPEKDCP